MTKAQSGNEEAKSNLSKTQATHLVALVDSGTPWFAAKKRRNVEIIKKPCGSSCVSSGRTSGECDIRSRISIEWASQGRKPSSPTLQQAAEYTWYQVEGERELLETLRDETRDEGSRGQAQHDPCGTKL